MQKILRKIVLFHPPHPPKPIEYIMDIILFNLACIFVFGWHEVASVIIAVGSIARIAFNLRNDWINRNNHNHNHNGVAVENRDNDNNEDQE